MKFFSIFIWVFVTQFLNGAVVTPNGSSLAYEMVDGIKVFRLVAEPIQQEFAPGFVVKCWGYNGQTPGPTIEVNDGDNVRLYVTNHLPTPTSIHWHGVLLPNGMDGVAGITQKPIMPGETFCYEFKIQQVGTCMYHSHYDEVTQVGMGLVGLFIIHPRVEVGSPVDRDYAIMLQEWAIPAGTSKPDPSVMLEFNTFTLNGKVFPATEALVASLGEKVRVRLGNLSMDDHPIHLHGHLFKISAMGGGPIPSSQQIEDFTISVPVGSTRDIEFKARAPGDWLFHCHKTHHMMTRMAHGLPNMMGVKQDKAAPLIQTVIPSYMPMGTDGMTMHMHDAMPPNSISHVFSGPFGKSFLGGMVTFLKVRDKIIEGQDPGWYKHPEGTVASPNCPGQ